MDNKKVDWLKRLKLLTKALEKKGVKTNLWMEIETKISGYELDFTEHDKKVLEDNPFKIKMHKDPLDITFEIDGKTHSAYSLVNGIEYCENIIKAQSKEKDSLEARIAELEKICDNSYEENKALKKCITELESKKTGNTEEIPDSITIDGYKCKIIKTESGLYISRDEIYSIIDKEKEPIKKQCKELEDRHQSDYIEINRLNTTIDVLIHKVEYLRQFAGLE